MRIKADGNVGIGTATPSRNLEVYRSGAVNFGLTAATSGNAAALFKGRSNVTNIATGPAQGGSNLSLYNLDTSDGNFNGFGFYNSNSLITSGILGVNVSHSSRHGALVFQTHNGSSLLERMRIDKDGNVGIGTVAPSQKLHVQGTLRLTGAFYDSNNAAGTSGQVLTSTGSATDWKTLDEISGVTASNPTTTNYVTKWSDGTNEVLTDSIIQDNGNIGIGVAPANGYKLKVAGNGYFSGTLTEASSLAIKENIENFTPSIDKINKIRPVKYNKKGSDKKEIGLIAEELEELFPELVEKDENGNPSGVNYSRAVTVLLGGFKELYKELQEIKKRI